MPPRRLLIQSKTKELKDISVQKEKTSVHIKFPTLTLVLQVPGFLSSDASNEFKQSAQKMLQKLDANKNGYLEEKDLQENRRRAYFRRRFKRWDTNADGKVYVDEIEASYYKLLSAKQSHIVVTASHQQEMLFDFLDETGDGRISLRELNNANKRLLTLDENHDGKLTANEFPEMITLTFNQKGRSVDTTEEMEIDEETGEPYQPPPLKQQGPKWFVHMDKNSDGDISPREFLGKPEMFKKLDSNHDGFIEKKEAEAVKIISHSERNK